MNKLLHIRLRVPPGRCNGKVRYGHLETAHRACESMAAKGVDGLSAYPCRVCSGFHIGHHIGLEYIYRQITNSLARNGRLT